MAAALAPAPGGAFWSQPGAGAAVSSAWAAVEAAPLGSPALSGALASLSALGLGPLSHARLLDRARRALLSGALPAFWAALSGEGGGGGGVGEGGCGEGAELRLPAAVAALHAAVASLASALPDAAAGSALRGWVGAALRADPSAPSLPAALRAFYGAQLARFGAALSARLREAAGDGGDEGGDEDGDEDEDDAEAAAELAA